MSGALEGVRVYASDQAHFSIDRGLSLLGFPEETLRVLPSDEPWRGLDSIGRAGLDHDLLALIDRFNRATDGSMVVPSEYLEVVVTRN